jgi:TolB-like protein/DNA-binding winged helix-turn-helix (wHTH) protein/tetratricopeptide (TPR) repeat protein
MAMDYRLGDWIIRPRRDLIERGGKTVHVKPKSMAVLQRLADSAGEVVTRDELFTAVWPGGVVTDDALTQCIVELRKAFGDRAQRPKVIETVPKVGFRLLPEVSPLEAPPGVTDSLKPGTRMALIAVSTVLLGLVFLWYLTGTHRLPPQAIVHGSPSVVVLPFADMSSGQDQEWLADGLTEELINRLAQLEGLQVTARTSSFHYKGRKEDPRKIGAELGVTHLLEGSLRRDETHLRITAQLIEADSGFHAWSRNFDRPREDFLAIQDEIAIRVAEALSVELQVGSRGTMPGGTDSVAAYEEMLHSKRYQWQATPESMVLAIDHIKNAIEIDPDYAYAWWRLAGLYINAHSILARERNDWLQLSEQALDRARRSEPDLPGVKYMTVMQGNLKMQWADTERILNGGADLALSTDFDLLSAWSDFLGRVGRHREKLALLKRMRAINPWSNGAARSLGRAYAWEDSMEEAAAEAERAFELNGFDAWDVSAGLEVARAADDRELLRKWLDRAVEHMTESRDLVIAMRATLDDPVAARSWLRNAFEESDGHDFDIAAWAAWHGDAGLALDAMDRLTVPGAFWTRDMKDVRRHPRFKDLVRKVGLEDYFREFGWNDYCRPLGEDDFECE